MTHLRIENQNSNVEIVNNAIILKLYNLSTEIELNLQEDELLSDYVSLKGNLLSDHAKLSAYNYLIGNFPDSNSKRFPNLTISIPLSGLYIDFADPVVRRRCIEIWGDENNEVTTNPTLRLSYMPNEPFARSTLNTAYGSDNCMIHTFDELSLITNLTGLNKSNFFNNLWSMTSIDLSNITSITGGYVFYGCANLLNLGETSQITSITGVSNFENCYKISEFDLNPSITNIPNNTFKECRALQLIDLSNVTNIGQSAFLGCTGLTSIDLSSLTTVGGSLNGGAFLGCTGLTTVTNLNKANALYMFYGCTGLTSVTLTQNCTNIALGAFNGCSNLSSVSGLSNVTKIDSWGFSNCRNLSLNVSLLLNLQEIGSYAFAYDSLVTGDLNLPNLTRYIEYGAFYNTSITKILSLGHIQSIQAASSNAESRAFGGCTSLTEVDLSTTTSLTSIGTAAFVGCTSLTLVKLPSSITSIEGWAFTASNNVIQTRTYYIYATTPPTLNAKHSIVSDATVASLPAAIYVPAGSVEDYKAASIWSDFASVILAIPE